MTQPIIEGADGVTLTSTGLVAVREHADFVDAALARQAVDKERAFRLVVTINHEGVHFLQCFTAAFPYSFSLSLLELSSELMTVCREGQLTNSVVEEFRHAFAGRVKQFKAVYRGLTTIDLLEAMAVTEGYRATAVDCRNNPNDFYEFLLRYFPNPDTEYRRIINIVIDRFGKEAGYNLTPRLCYIALNGDHPAQNLWDFIDLLVSDQADTAKYLTATDVLDLFGMNIQNSILYLSSRELPPNSQHPIFIPYMKELATIGTIGERYEFAAQPGTWLRGNSPERLMRIVPPLLVCSGGRGTVMGLARNWSKEELFTYLDTAALIGIMLVLLSGNKNYQTCQYTECPIYESTLCHAWFAKPHDIPLTDCAFPKRLKVQFGMSFDELLNYFNS